MPYDKTKNEKYWCGKYRKIGAHRHKCAICHKLIDDGVDTVFLSMVVEKYYPVKGLMGFKKMVYFIFPLSYWSFYNGCRVCIFHYSV